MQLQFKINLLGAYEEVAGDVVTQDGEIIGFWSLIDGAIYDFTPLDGDRPIFSHSFIWALCDQIGKWLEQQSEYRH
ncbi:MAG: hypothetical protein EKK31_29890 [Hyphomicrobiales bacterium]|nr:MAG: hypothetical protein EKK31_29890 [Hyphomicrobiales bacterium]